METQKQNNMGATKDLVVQLQEEMYENLNKHLTTLDGTLDPLHNVGLLDGVLYAETLKSRLKAMLKTIDEFEQEHLTEITEKIQEYPDGYNGYTVQVRKGRTTYDFKNVPEWVELDRQKKQCEGKYKAIIEAVNNGAIYANVDENGEELILPTVKTGKSSVIVKPKKA